jgi:hypothetical protein
MNIKAILVFCSVLMVTALMIFVVINIWMPDLIDPGVFKKTVYTIAVLAGGAVVVSALTFCVRFSEGGARAGARSGSADERRASADTGSSRGSTLSSLR